MKKFLPIGLVLAALFTVGLAGCGLDQHPSYSDKVKYGVRQDPIVKGAAKDLGDDRYDPERPGILPLMKVSDVQKPEHPMYPNREKMTDGVLRDPTKITAKDRAEIEAALEAQFGTPANPTMNAKAGGIDDSTIKDLQIDDETLKEGSKHYRVHCLHCHGVPGDGRGPTARWISPHPRDFRSGFFKFQSVDQADGTTRPPSRADLLRTLRQGIESTAMPSFNLLGDKELNLLVSYVIHLSVRGQTELMLIKEYYGLDNNTGALVWNGGPQEFEKNEEAIRFLFKKILQTPSSNKDSTWLHSNSAKAAIQPVAYPYKEGDMDALKESVKRGYQFFIGDEKLKGAKDVKCMQCHENFGREAKFKFDDWGTLTRPNNLTLGHIRGGKRPIDIYYRVHSGINGSNMNRFGSTIKGEEIWDIVNFVTVLSYPAMHKKLDIRLD